MKYPVIVELIMCNFMWFVFNKDESTDGLFIWDQSTEKHLSKNVIRTNIWVDVMRAAYLYNNMAPTNGLFSPDIE